jgi:hypothetical protein
MKKLAVLFLAAGIAAGFLGCSKSSPTSNTVTVHDTTYVAQAKVIYAWVVRDPYIGDTRAYVYGDPPPSLAQSSAQMKYGGTQVQFYYKYQWPGFIAFYDTIRPSFGINCSLFVTTNLGSSRGGGVCVPESLTMTSPREGDTLAWGNVTISWTQAQYATWYDLDVYYTAYRDTQVVGESDTSLYPTGTSVLIPQSFFTKYPSATHLLVDAVADPCTGPTPGASGNMTGEIKGVFWGSFFTWNNRRFLMGNPPLAPYTGPPPPRASREERRERLLKAFKAKFQSEAD